MNTEIFHSLSCIEKNELYNVVKVLESAYLKGGQSVKFLQNTITRDMGMAASLATHTGSLAIFLALKSLELPADAGVVVPAYICDTVAIAVRMAGLIPFFCDVTIDDCALDFACVEKEFDGSVGAIIIAHLFGNIAEVESFRRFAVPIIEDAAQCPGGHNLGKYSDMAVFSFEGTKMLCAGEGGILAIKTNLMAQRLKERIAKGDICSLTPTDLQAAVALSQWNKRQNMIEKRRILAQKYDRAFFPEGIKRVGNKEGLYSRYVISDCQNVGEMIERAGKAYIHLRCPVAPEAIATQNWKKYPVTRHLVETNLSLPIYPDLMEEDQSRVIRFVLENIRIR